MFGLHKSTIFCHTYFKRAKLEPFCERRNKCISKILMYFSILSAKGWCDAKEHVAAPLTQQGVPPLPSLKYCKRKYIITPTPQRNL